MSVASLVRFISAEVCKALMVSGYVAASVNVAGATNASPIVVTTATPHLLADDAVVLVAGVGGNGAANDYWNIRVTSTTTFELVGSHGNGAYTSGGTVSSALVMGKILLGRQWVRQQQASPRVVFIPVAGEFPARDQYATAVVGADLTDPQRAALLAPAVLLHRNVFEVQVWGRAPTPDPDANFTYTEFVRDQVIRTCDALFRGNYTCRAGVWDDQLPNATQDMKLGHVYRFQLTIDAPITAEAKAFAPPGVSATIGVYFVPADGAPPGELAATIQT